MAQKPGPDSVKRQVVEYDPEEYTLRKCLPINLPRMPNDVYVNSKTNFKHQLSRCKQLLLSDYDHIVIHGLGVAVNRAVNMALLLKAEYLDTLELSVNTSTVRLTDYLVPENDDLEERVLERNNSAVHIKVYKT